jgi:hypothetical protein
MEMCHPNKQQIVRDIARLCRVHRAVVIGDLVYWADRLQEEQPDVFNALHWSFEGVREFQEPVRYARRKKPLRPVLAPRRVGEERQTSRRYRNPAALLPQLLPQAVSSTATAAIN